MSSTQLDAPRPEAALPQANRGLDLPPLRDPSKEPFVSGRDPAVTRLVNAMFKPVAAVAARGFNRKIEALRRQERERIKVEGGRPVDVVFWNDIPDVLAIRPEEELDFLEYRSPMYVPRLTHGVASQIARWMTGQQKYQPASDETMAHMVLHTPISHAIEHREVEGEPCLVFDLSMQRAMTPSKRATFNVDMVAVGTGVREGKRALFLRMDDGAIYRPGDPAWEMAKLYFQVAWAYATVGMVHTWVHFAFPNCAAAVLENQVLEGRIDRAGNLYKLLAPHLRFPMRINWQALHVSKFTADREPSFASTANPWNSLPMDTGTFTANIASRVASHYFQDDDQTGVFPPRFDDTKPYDQFTRGYWREIRDFVGILSPALDDGEYEAFAGALAAFLPDVKRAAKDDVLASLIWQAGVLHATDHYSAYQYCQYGVPMATRRFDPASAKAPADLVSGWSLMQWRNASNIFVSNLDDDTLDVATGTTDYGFADPALQASNAAFRERLATLDATMAAEGRQICPLRYMVRSICY